MKIRKIIWLILTVSLILGSQSGAYAAGSKTAGKPDAPKGGDLKYIGTGIFDTFLELSFSKVEGADGYQIYAKTLNPEDELTYYGTNKGLEHFMRVKNPKFEKVWITKNGKSVNFKMSDKKYKKWEAKRIPYVFNVLKSKNGKARYRVNVKSPYNYIFKVKAYKVVNGKKVFSKFSEEITYKFRDLSREALIKLCNETYFEVIPEGKLEYDLYTWKPGAWDTDYNEPYKEPENPQKLGITPYHNSAYTYGWRREMIIDRYASEEYIKKRLKKQLMVHYTGSESQRNRYGSGVFYVENWSDPWPEKSDTKLVSSYGSFNITFLE